MTNKQEPRLLVVDGNSWMHRAFHALAMPLTAPDGTPTNAVFGFLNILIHTVNALKPDAVIIAFDAGKPKFRTEALKEYKAQRKPTDPDLKVQFPLIENLLEVMNIPVVKKMGWEGDDIIGTLSLMGERAGFRVFLGTGDRDAYQLVSEKTSVVTSKKGISDVVLITPEAVRERYGINPDQVVDFLGLKGDSSDNIPGVPSIGEKTASRLLQEYGDLESVIQAACAGKITGRAGASLVENEDAAHVSQIVATIRRDVDIDLDMSAISFGQWDNAAVTKAFDALRLRAQLKKFLALGSGGAAGASAATAGAGAGDAGAGAGATDAGAGAADVVSEMPDGAALAAKSRYVGVASCQGGETLFDHELYVGVASGVEGEEKSFAGEAAEVELARLLDEEPVAALDIKQLIRAICPPDTSQSARIALDSLHVERFFDVHLAAYLLESTRTDFSLGTLCNDHLGVEYTPPLEDAPTEERLGYDARMTAQLAAVLEAALEKKPEALKLYRSLEMPLLGVLARMEHVGIKVDVARLDELRKEGTIRIDQLEEEIYKLAGHEFTINSPRAIGTILFEELGLPPGKKTKTGYSTDASVLEGLRDAHAIVPLILEYRMLSKLRSTYLEPLPHLVAGDGRIHTTFTQAVAATGRLSSVDPNLQNIPVRTEEGRRIRSAFIPSHPDWQLMSVDYSQIELRILAQLSGDEGLIAAFTQGEDFHQETAAKIFDVSPDEVDSTMRSRAKAVNFGIVYGQGARALGLSLDISFADAQDMIDRYYRAYPGVRTYLDGLKRQAQKTGHVSTLWGRVRPVPEAMSSRERLRAIGERAAMNHPMQGTAADLIKGAMIEVDRRLRAQNLVSQLLLQVHDELVLDVAPQEVETVQKLVTECMSGIVDFKVPLDVSVNIGPDWAALK